MREGDILKDILQYRITNQSFYNNNLINIRNPEIRQIFTQLRDDETRSIVKLQQKIERLEGKKNIIAKIFPTRPNY